MRCRICRLESPRTYCPTCDRAMERRLRPLSTLPLKALIRQVCGESQVDFDRLSLPHQNRLLLAGGGMRDRGEDAVLLSLRDELLTFLADLR